MGFKDKLTNDETFENGIGRFEIETDYPSDIIWRKDHMKIDKSCSILKYERVKMTKTRQALIVKNCKFNDFGVYQAQCGQDVCEAELIKSTPFNRAIPSYIEAYRNDITVITADLKPGCYANWFYQNQPINSSNFSILKYEIRNVDNRSELIIKNISDCDFTFFVCESRGERYMVELRERSPFTSELCHAYGNEEGIAVFSVEKQQDVRNPVWLIENTKIDSSKFSMLKYEIRNELLKSTLIVKNIKPADFTVFSCESNGVRVSASLLTESPFIIPPPQQIDGITDDIEVISTTVRPGASVTWSVNGKTINPENFSILKFEERSVGNRRDLIIKNIKTEDAGLYIAECAGVQFKTKFNLVGLKKWTTSYIHSNLASEKKFQAPLRNQMAYIGSIALFECCTRNTEMPVSWFVNGKLICGQTFSILKYEQLTRNNYHRLIIKNISKADYGTYSIQCGNEKLEATLSQLNPFLDDMDDVDGLLGDIEVCKVKTQPDVQVTWYFGREKITRHNFSLLKYEERSVGNERHLIVKNIQPQDAGMYYACAQGVSKSAKLQTVSDVKESTTFKSKCPFTSNMKHIYGLANDVEVFRVNTAPGVRVNWYFGHTKITPETFSILKYEVVRNRTSSHLIIKNITWRDCGVYSASAYGTTQNAMLKLVNRFEDTTTFKQRKFDELMLEKPFKSDLKDCGGFITNSVVYEVEVDPDVPVKWYHGEKEITKNDTKYEERKYGKHRRLIIKNLSMGDFSYMACESRGQRLVRYFTYDEQQ